MLIMSYLDISLFADSRHDGSSSARSDRAYCHLLPTRISIAICSRSCAASRSLLRDRSTGDWSSYKVATWIRFLHDHGDRVRLIRSINFTITFPELQHTPEHPLKCWESLEDLQVHDKLFTHQLSELFVLLDTIQKRSDQPRGINLTIKTTPQRDNRPKHCYHRRFHSWRLHLFKLETLPELPSVCSLVFEAKNGSFDFSDKGVQPVDLVSKLPNLEALDCPYLFERFPEPYEDAVISHFTRPWESPWRDARHDFALALYAEEGQAAFLGRGLADGPEQGAPRPRAARNPRPIQLRSPPALTESHQAGPARYS